MLPVFHQPLRPKPDGRITGIVADASGGVIPGADVELLNQNTGETKTVVTNAAGE